MLPLPIAGGKISLKPDYHIQVAEGECLIIKAGVGVEKAAAKFTHPNVLLKAPCVHEFKRYFPNGGKKWIAKPGFDFYFVIPKEFITVSEEPGHSYVPAEINGVSVTLNVSGGSINGWTDLLSRDVSICVNHPTRDLAKFAEVALPPDDAKGYTVTVEPLSERSQAIFDQGAAKASQLGKLAPTMRIALREGFSVGAAEEKELVIESYKGRGQSVLARCAAGLKKVYYNEIDWVRTVSLQSAA